MGPVTQQSIYSRERALGVNWLAHRHGCTDSVEDVEKKFNFCGSAGNQLATACRLVTVLTELPGLQIDG
jgi:rRNA maturation endonuclease Nob1